MGGAFLLSIALAAVALPAATTPAGAWQPKDPYKPRGGSSSDEERQQPLPPGFRDIKGPVVVDPPGRPRPATSKRTNIVVVVIDDIAEMDERVWERLPTIRRLFVERGLRFTNTFGNDPLCCPGRANLLTGLTTDHHGVYTNDVNLMDTRVTLATRLQDAGYHTFLTGKYLNGGPPRDPTPPGWDRIAFTGNAYYRYYEWVDGIARFHDDDANDYQPDVTFNQAMAMLRAAPPDQPIFAFLNPYSVHAGRDPRDPDGQSNAPVVADRFKGDPACADIPPWVTAAHADDLSDRPLHQRGWRAKDGYDLRLVCESLLATDEGLGRLVEELIAQKRYKHTLFVLTADNGMGYGAHGWVRKTVSFATPIPFYLSWKDGRGLERADEHAFVSNTDLAPTLCAVGGCRMGPYPDGPTRPDGINLLPLIEGSATLRREAVYTQHLTGVAWRAVRTSPDHPLGTWTYTRYATDERELYDVSGGPCHAWTVGDPGDPCELTNLAGDPAYAETESTLSALLALAVATGGAAESFRGELVPR